MLPRAHAFALEIPQLTSHTWDEVFRLSAPLGQVFLSRGSRAACRSEWGGHSPNGEGGSLEAHRQETTVWRRVDLASSWWGNKEPPGGKGQMGLRQETP